MSIQQSIKFLQTAMNSSDFRSILNELPPHTFSAYLTESGFEFTAEEFEESINLMHVKCQFEEDAHKLFEAVLWYKILSTQN